MQGGGKRSGGTTRWTVSGSPADEDWPCGDSDIVVPDEAAGLMISGLRHGPASARDGTRPLA